MSPMTWVILALFLIGAFLLLPRIGIKMGTTSKYRTPDGVVHDIPDSWPLKIYKWAGLWGSQFHVNSTCVSVFRLAHGGHGGAHQKVMLVFHTEDGKAIWGVDMTPQSARTIGAGLMEEADYMESFGGKDI